MHKLPRTVELFAQGKDVCSGHAAQLLPGWFGDAPRCPPTACGCHHGSGAGCGALCTSSGLVLLCLPALDAGADDFNAVLQVVVGALFQEGDKLCLYIGIVKDIGVFPLHLGKVSPCLLLLCLLLQGLYVLFKDALPGVSNDALRLEGVVFRQLIGGRTCSLASCCCSISARACISLRSAARACVLRV